MYFIKQGNILYTNKPNHVGIKKVNIEDIGKVINETIISYSEQDNIVTMIRYLKETFAAKREKEIKVKYNKLKLSLLYNWNIIKKCKEQNIW